MAPKKGRCSHRERQYDHDDAHAPDEDLVVPREDIVQSLQMLDMAVYNNVFTTEQNGQGARGRGVSVDRDTPLRHLRDGKAALDEIIAFAP